MTCTHIIRENVYELLRVGIDHYTYLKRYVIGSICDVEPVLHFRRQKKEDVSRETSSLSMSKILFSSF